MPMQGLNQDTCHYLVMSFFQQEGDDSNLQYDDAAFIYFIASALSVTAIALTVSLARSLLSLRLGQESRLEKVPAFREKLGNLRADRRRSQLTLGFAVRVVLLVLVCLTFMRVRQQSKKAESKLKGFDPFEILGVGRNASLGEIKKAYRKLAVHFHPDKNHGNAEAQNKFILISKSYECFTNEEKKSNCFKYGNPDGETAFRVGIGLPNFFIKVEYQFYVLPLVLAVLLVLVPCLMISWNNKTRALDNNGIAIASYATLFKSFEPNIDKFTFLYILASYPELHEDLPPISPDHKQQMLAALQATPHAEKTVLHQMTDSQLLVLWEVFQYASNARDYSVPGLRQKVETYLGKTLEVVKMFMNREAEGTALLGNPEWTIRYLGPLFFDVYVDFQRDYFARTLLTPPANDNWLNQLSLSEEERLELKEKVRKENTCQNLLEVLLVEEKLRAFCGKVGQARREGVEGELRSWPVYELQVKLKLEGRETNDITHVSYPFLYYRVKQRNSSQGFSFIKNCPYPRRDKVYILGIEDGNVTFIREAVIPPNGEYVQRVPYRTGVVGNHSLRVFVVHEACRGIDVAALLNFTVTQAPAADLEKPIVFHPDDMNMEKLYKSFIEEVLDLQMDPEANVLSDSEEEEEGKGKEQEEEKEEKEEVDPEANVLSDSEEEEEQEEEKEEVEED